MLFEEFSIGFFEKNSYRIKRMRLNTIFYNSIQTIFSTYELSKRNDELMPFSYKYFEFRIKFNF